MDDILRMELRFLLLRYGRHRVLRALAALGEQTQADIENELAVIEKRKPARKPNTPPSATELARQLSSGKTESAQMLQTLATRYDNRTFLPQLRDVQRFLDRVGFPHGRLKSRREAARRVLEALSRLRIDDLRRLSTSPGVEGESAFAELAREIMGQRPAHRGPSKGDE